MTTANSTPTSTTYSVVILREPTHQSAGYLEY